jgi:hypothetical protein
MGARARRTAGVAVLVLVGTGLLWARIRQAEDRDEAALARGARALRAALEGRRETFSEAEAAFRDASGSMLLDAYPLFALELTLRFREGRAGVEDRRLDPVVEALARGRIEEADRLLETTRDASGYAWLRRLLDDMQALPP